MVVVFCCCVVVCNYRKSSRKHLMVAPFLARRIKQAKALAGGRGGLPTSALMFPYSQQPLSVFQIQIPYWDLPTYSCISGIIAVYHHTWIVC
jgi:hypothetical protein